MTSPLLPSGAELQRQLERIEIQQYQDFVEAIPPTVRDKLGIQFRRTGSMFQLTATGYDHPMFNRIMGVGLDPPGAGLSPEALLDHAVAHYGEAGVRRGRSHPREDRLRLRSADCAVGRAASRPTQPQHPKSHTHGVPRGLCPGQLGASQAPGLTTVWPFGVGLNPHAGA